MVVGPWQGQVFGALGSTFFIQAGDWTTNQFRERGARLRAGNRLERARQLAADTHEGRLSIAAADEPTLARLSEALRTIWEFHLIARCLPRADPAIPAKIEELLKGPELPRLDKNDHARNTQFELYVGAQF